MYIEDTCKTEPEAVNASVHNQAILELAQRQELLGRINQSLKSSLPQVVPPQVCPQVVTPHLVTPQVVTPPDPVKSGPSSSGASGSQPVTILPKPVKPVVPPVSPSQSVTHVTPSTPFEVALDKVSKSIEGWSREAREYHAKMNQLMRYVHNHKFKSWLGFLPLFLFTIDSVQ